jgi:hypothetical protein
MEILAAGIVGEFWELRLSVARREIGYTRRPLRKGTTIEAVVVAHEQQGVALEAANGQRLWMPAIDLLRRPGGREPAFPRVGELLEVRVQGISQDRKRYHVSQRALVEPYLSRLERGRRVTGVLFERSLASGEWFVLLDPIPGISSQRFLARTEGCAAEALQPRTRISAKVSKHLTREWLVTLADVLPDHGSPE